MSEIRENLPHIPERIILSGEGLQRMDAGSFRVLVQCLGSLGIDVEEAFIEEHEIARKAERAENPQAIYKKDFVLSAIKHDLSRVNVGRTWSTLTAPWKKYHHALQKLSEGSNLYSWEKDIITKPAWQRELCTAEDELSRPNLRAAYKSELLDDLDGMGPKYIEVVGVVLSDLEEEEEYSFAIYKKEPQGERLF